MKYDFTYPANPVVAQGFACVDSISEKRAARDKRGPANHRIIPYIKVRFGQNDIP
jgi:hypothetical protein